MLFWILLVAGIYVVGALTTFILDGWFDWSNSDSELLAILSLAWPLVIAFSPIILADLVRNKLKAAKKKKEEREEEQVKIRIAAEAEVKKIEEQLDSYSEEEIEKVRAA